MTFLQPIYLWSMLLLVVPIVVHLFSKNNPPRIKIGTVKFLKQAESRTFRRIKLHDALLFVLRATIFALLSVLTASPEIACKQKPSEKGWILIEPNLSLEEQPAEFHRIIDSLLKKGYETRWLESEFSELSFLETEVPTTSRAKEKNGATDLWSLLAEADEVNRDTLAFFVASTRRESSLQGKRPTLARQVKWIEVGAQETAWIERIAQLSDDSLFVGIGISSPNETRFEHLVVATPEKATLAPPIELTRKGDSIGVSLLSKPNQIEWLMLTKRRSWCIVYDEHFAKTLPYFERAVSAVAQFSPIKISVEVKKQAEWRREAEAQVIWLCKSAQPEHPRLLDATGLTSESPFDERFIDALSQKLLPERVSENDVRKAPSNIAAPITRREPKPLEETRRTLAFPIWILVTLLLGLERWTAFSKE